MKILGIDSSATSASVAIAENGKILGETFVNVGLTHSQTLMPMVDDLLKSAKLDINDIDAFAVTNGPGSFTGIRIGVSAIKGIAFTGDKPCVAVSTLEAIAYGAVCADGIVCAVMDARCSQVYAAIFEIKNGTMKRITEDEAITIKDLAEKLKIYDSKIILIGDGAEVCYNYLSKDFDNLFLAPSNVEYQRASSVVLLAEEKIKLGEAVNASALVPKYLRLPQAERELRKKLQEEKE